MTALTGEEKAGLLLLSLRPQVAAAVLNKLGPAAKARLAGHMQRLAASPQRNELVDQILQEAEGVLHKLTLRLTENVDREPEPAPLVRTDRVVGDSPTPGLRIAQVGPYADTSDSENGDPKQNDNDAASALNRVPQERLLLALDNENPRTIALILNCLGPDKAGNVFKDLQPAVRREVSVQLGTCVMPNPQIVERTVRAMLAKEQTLPKGAGASKGDARFKKTAELLRKLERTDRADALTALQERDANAAAQVREFLYSFEDLLILDGRSLQKVLGELDGKILALAMKGASEDIMAKITGNMSKRAREGLAEEMEFLATAPANQIKQAQKAIVEIIQRLDQAGDIVMLT